MFNQYTEEDPKTGMQDENASSPPKFYGLPFTRRTSPLPIVSSIGSVSYGVAIVNIKPLMVQSIIVHNSTHAEEIKTTKI